MAILGANFGEVAIPKTGGGYYVSQPVNQTIKHTTTSVPKKTTYKAPSKPKYVAPKTVAAPTSSASIQTVAAPQAAPAPPAPSIDDLVNQYYNASLGDVNKLYDQQKQSQFDALKAQRNTAIAGINQQKADTQHSYYDQRNAADAVNLQNAQKLREIMGANGLLASGENITATARLNADRQGSLNALNMQEQSKMNDYANQINSINDPSKDQAITNQIEAARTQALLNAKQQAYQRAWQQYGFDNMSAAQQAQLAMSKYNLDSTNAANSAASQAALNYYGGLGFNSGSGGGGNTSAGNAAYQQNLQAAIKRGLDPSWTNAMNYIIQRESGFNPGAQNKTSTAHGYAQFLNSTASSYDKKMGLNYNASPVDQLLEMQQYLKDRYKTPQGAVNFWSTNHWY